MLRKHQSPRPEPWGFFNPTVCRANAPSGRFAAKKFILLFAAAVGAAKTAEEEHADTYSDEHCKNSSKRK
jgi:hypothetical protein